MKRTVGCVLVAVALGGCCKTVPDKPRFESKRDIPAEQAIISELNSSSHKGETWFKMISTVQAKTSEDGTIYAKIETSLYPKKGNEPEGISICWAVLGQTFNGKKLRSVEVNAGDWRLGKTMSGVCVPGSKTW